MSCRIVVELQEKAVLLWRRMFSPYGKGVLFILTGKISEPNSLSILKTKALHNLHIKYPTSHFYSIYILHA